MESIREIVNRIAAQTEESDRQSLGIAADYYRRISIISYADALQKSPCRDPSATEDAIKVAREFAEKSIVLGMPEDRMHRELDNLRKYWIPRLSSGPNKKG